MKHDWFLFAINELLAVILALASVVAEAPAPYAPSGWKPEGPAFVLPQRGQLQPQQTQNYLPPFDPRNPAIPVIPSNEYGIPNDVSVQGLPTQEQQPIFQTSPINGQENQGPYFTSDIKNLDENLKQNQYQIQQENYRTFQRQKQLEAAQAKNQANNLPAPQAPRQFASRTTARPTSTTPAERTTEAPATQVTEANLNEREILEDDSSPAKLQQKTSVEITRQNIQQYPGELYLASLAQLRLQPQFVPLQQIRDSYVQPLQVEQKPAGFDGPAHFAAFPSVLAQQQVEGQQNINRNPPLLIGEQAPPNYLVQQPAAQFQPAYQPDYQQPIALQPQALQPNYLAPNSEAVGIQQQVQYQPAATYQPQQFPQLQAQPVLLQPTQINQPTQFAAQPAQESENNNREEVENIQPQVYQPQTQPNYQQPQVYQPPVFVQQPVNQYQAPLFPAQLISQDQLYQGQFQPQFVAQPAQQNQGTLQSGLDVDQEGNDLEQSEEAEDDDEGSKATAVATVFGARTQPRVITQYGAPYPVPRQQASPGYQTTTESAVEEVTEEGPAIAQAVAVSNGGRRKNAKLRTRRLRPVFTLDRSGHLVLAQEQ
uniref:Cuticle protein n=2 Tax=Bombyx mori TaxID=7091 RepID=A0A8R2HNR9_BOMMO|nr:probable basic-leucine zipper transcription factor I isoform X1 [Bombyx mori]